MPLTAVLTVPLHMSRESSDCCEMALTSCAFLQDWFQCGALSDNVLKRLASPLLEPCKVQQLRGQQNITSRGIAALAGGRFPGGLSYASSDCFAVCRAIHACPYFSVSSATLCLHAALQAPAFAHLRTECRNPTF